MTDAGTGSTTLEHKPPDLVQAELQASIAGPETWQFYSEPYGVPGSFGGWSETSGSTNFVFPKAKVVESDDILIGVSNRRLQARWKRLVHYTYPSRPPRAFSDPSTEELVLRCDLPGQFVAELLQRSRDSWHDRRAYELRIEVLRADAELESSTVNEGSERDFWAFVGSTNFSRRALLALMDNGNLRAVWKGEYASHLGLHFLGDGVIQYVIFKRRSASRQISRVAGTDTFKGIKKQIGAFDLMNLLNG